MNKWLILSIYWILIITASLYSVSDDGISIKGVAVLVFFQSVTILLGYFAGYQKGKDDTTYKFNRLRRF